MIAMTATAVTMSRVVVSDTTSDSSVGESTVTNSLPVSTTSMVGTTGGQGGSGAALILGVVVGVVLAVVLVVVVVAIVMAVCLVQWKRKRYAPNSKGIYEVPPDAHIGEFTLKVVSS